MKCHQRAFPEHWFSWQPITHSCHQTPDLGCSYSLCRIQLSSHTCDVLTATERALWHCWDTPGQSGGLRMGEMGLSKRGDEKKGVSESINILRIWQLVSCEFQRN